MAMVGWLASHTGLPSVYSADPVRVTCGSRVLADGSGPVLVSDALAEPGAATTYTVGDETITLTRATGRMGQAILTNSRGRGIPGLIYANNGDKVAWSSSISRFNDRVERWSMTDPLVSGVGQVVLTDPAREADVWRVLRSHAPIIIAPDQSTPGVSLRCVTVDSVSRSRISRRGVLSFDVSWTESRSAVSRSGAAPVVSWGEWEALGEGWQDRTMLDLCRLIAGMPAAGPAHVLGHADPALLPGSARQGDGWIASDSADWGAVDARQTHGLVRPVIVLSSVSEDLPGSATAGDVWMAMDSGDFGRVA
jgi:hypothetical protein